MGGTMEITEADIIRMRASMEGIRDPRRKRGNLRHKPEDMPVIALSRIIIGENDFESMEDWGLAALIRYRCRRSIGEQTTITDR
jgi:hypothetical protein